MPLMSAVSRAVRIRFCIVSHPRGSPAGPCPALDVVAELGQILQVPRPVMVVLAGVEVDHLLVFVRGVLLPEHEFVQITEAQDEVRHAWIEGEPLAGSSSSLRIRSNRGRRAYACFFSKMCRKTCRISDLLFGCGCQLVEQSLCLRKPSAVSASRGLKTRSRRTEMDAAAGSHPVEILHSPPRCIPSLIFGIFHRTTSDVLQRWGVLPLGAPTLAQVQRKLHPVSSGISIHIGIGGRVGESELGCDTAFDFRDWLTIDPAGRPRALGDSMHRMRKRAAAIASSHVSPAFTWAHVAAPNASGGVPAGPARSYLKMWRSGWTALTMVPAKVRPNSLNVGGRAM